ncbi:helix-turn-helix transcriptional regulator [Labedella endophytica]|uniref:XRE family transcriptional regulator n=1 Tax=Labedella endophytica TaxID=1523160 RepID=A0A433JS82_9MICO|nr:helix-turn-helix transcriptional regulator [Labedella endophytica]RUR01176.1 XRE family transcriptional regulator [Labedella endophytica]
MTSDLGDYLRARRAATSPESAGFPSGGRRQVAGLRREEVAVAAGMSADYYIRLEQGRETNPSPAVLDALGRVLGLDDEARQHLFRLAGLGPAPASSAGERAAPELLALLDSWPNHPAMVLGRSYDVLAANTLGRALFPSASYPDNLAQMLFLDPHARSLWVDWASAAAATVAGLRLAVAAAPADLRLRAVVDELREASAEFAELWQTAEARSKRLTEKQFLHPDVGSLTVRSHSFDVRAAPGQELVVYLAEPGSASAQALALLGSLAATRVR